MFRIRARVRVFRGLGLGFWEVVDLKSIMQVPIIYVFTHIRCIYNYHVHVVARVKTSVDNLRVRGYRAFGSTRTSLHE